MREGECLRGQFAAIREGAASSERSCQTGVSCSELRTREGTAAQFAALHNMVGVSSGSSRRQQTASVRFRPIADICNWHGWVSCALRALSRNARPAVDRSWQRSAAHGRPSDPRLLRSRPRAVHNERQVRDAQFALSDWRQFQPPRFLPRSDGRSIVGRSPYGAPKLPLLRQTAHSADGCFCPRAPDSVWPS